MIYNIELLETNNYNISIKTNNSIEETLSSIENENSIDDIKLKLSQHGKILGIDLDTILKLEYKNIFFSVSEIKTMCEALHNFLFTLKNYDPEEAFKKAMTLYKINEVEELFNKVQDMGNYNFYEKLNKCKNSKSTTDIGEDPLYLSNKKI